MAMDRSALNLIALVKPEFLAAPAERYIFLYDDTPECAEATIQVIGRFARNPELSLTWDDAATLARKITDRRNNDSNNPPNKPPRPKER